MTWTEWLRILLQTRWLRSRRWMRRSISIIHFSLGCFLKLLNASSGEKTCLKWSTKYLTNKTSRNVESRKKIGFGGGYWESTSRGQATLGWTANDACRYMDQRTNHLHDPAFSNVRMPTTPIEKRLSTAPKQPLASKWGLDKLYRWKLGREFAEAYPFLDCSAGKFC